jgi:hypothetical protein
VTKFDVVRLSDWAIDEASLLGNVYPLVASEPGPGEEEAFPSSVLREGNVFTVAFDDVAHFSVCFDTKTITLLAQGLETTPECLTHLIYDHLAPRILAHSGYSVLHGAAVEIDGELAVFVGDTGAGKSTLSASFHRSGYGLLGDDAVIVTSHQGRFHGEPVYPSLRLYPEAITALLGDDTDVSQMAYYSDKQRVNLDALAKLDSAAGPLSPVPFSTLFFLTGDCGATRAEARAMTPGETCIGLINQSFLLDPADAQMAASRLGKFSRMAEQVAAFELSYPHDFDQLERVHAMILSCMAQSRAHHEGWTHV